MSILAQQDSGSVGPLLGLVVLLVIVNAVLAGSEVALVSLREGQINRLEQRGRGGRVLGELARNPNRFLSAVQIGITLSGFLASATASVTLAQPLVGPLGFLGSAAEPAAIVVVTAILTSVTLVLGELAPKRIALARAEGWAMLAARPIDLLASASAPLVWVLTKATDGVVRLFGIDPREAREEISEEELRDMVATQSALDPEQRRLLAGAFEVAERSLRDVLVPRGEVVSLEGGALAAEALQLLAASGRSRAPVVHGGLDEVTGVAHLRDLVDADGTVDQHARRALFLPESVRVLDALRRLQTERQQLAVVVDEYGGTAGIVTFEDLLEEIVGEVYDEFDRELHPTDARGAVPLEGGGWELPGTFPVHDLPDLGVDLPEGEYSTIAGLLIERLGEIPEVGDDAEVEGWRIEVVVREGVAVRAVRLVPLQPAEARDAADAAAAMDA